MGKVRMVSHPDKAISIIHPAPNSKRPDETDEQWQERVFDKAMQGDLRGLPFKDIDISLLPKDRTERNRWEFDVAAEKIIVNPNKPLVKSQ